MVAFTLLLALTASLGALASPHDDDAPTFELGPNNPLALRRRQLDYNQNWKAGQGNINYQASNNGYSVSFSNAGDFVVGKGWRTGKARNITFEGSTQQTAGTVLVSVYGWTKNPLIEYYIQEYTSNGAGSAQGQKVGSFSVDGSTYDVWKHQQVNQPSISGTATFWQYISNRASKRPGSGTVNIGAHFEQWKKLGLNLGSQHDYQVLATEGWGNAGGNSKYTLSETSGGGGNNQQPVQPVQPATTARPATTAAVTKVETKTETKTVVSTVTSTAPAITKTETKTVTEAKPETVLKTEVKTVTEAGKPETVLKTETVVKTELVLVQTVPACANVGQPAPTAAAPVVATNVVSLG